MGILITVIQFEIIVTLAMKIVICDNRELQGTTYNNNDIPVREKYAS